MQKGDVVLINGATGVSARMAVQAAKYRGASRIIVTGRNAQSLAYLKQVDADVCISLLDGDAAIMQQLMQVQQQTPIDHALDYLWGKPAELLLSVLAKQCEKPINIITIGQMASAKINLPSSILRSQPISLLGSGFGSISTQLMHDYHQNELPKLFALAAEGRLLADYGSTL